MQEVQLQHGWMIGCEGAGVSAVSGRGEMRFLTSIHKLSKQEPNKETTSNH
jgi:hypothetical protein